MKKLASKIAIMAVLVLVITFVPVFNAKSAGTVYEVGPGKQYAELTHVIGALNPGDTVRVYYRENAYYGTVELTRSGNAANPITIMGISDAQGRKPVLRGSDTTNINILVMRASYYIIDNLEIYGNQGISSSVTMRGIYNVGHKNIIRRCIVHHAGQGIISADQGSGSLTVEFTEVYSNGAGAADHNMYLASDQARYPDSVITVRFCYSHDANYSIGLKTRARRNNIYYNVFENNPATAMDLLGPDFGDGFNPEPPPGHYDENYEGQTKQELRKIDPTYGEDYFREDSDVVGNLIIMNHAGNVARIGGDGGSGSNERSGTSFGRMRFVNNTIVYNTSGSPYRGIRLTHGMGSVDYHNNILYSTGSGSHWPFNPNRYTSNNSPTVISSDLRWLCGDSDGQYYGTNNYIKNFVNANMPAGISRGTDSYFSQSNTGVSSSSIIDDPGFNTASLADGYFLNDDSPLVDAGTTSTVKTWDDYIYFSNVGGNLVTDNKFPNPLLLPEYLPIDVATLRALDQDSDLTKAIVARGENASNISIGAYPPISRNMNFSLTSLDYSVGDIYITNVAEVTPVSGFLSKFAINTGFTLELVDDGGAAVNSGYVKTGYAIKVMKDFVEMGSFTICVKGDVLSTGIVMLGSAAKVMAHVGGEQVLNPAQMIAADVNNDGNVDIQDVQKLLDYNTGLVTVL